ncbi:MAG: glycosyltransferase family 4 protein [Nitrospirales bacterium]
MRFCMITTFYPPYHFGGDAMYVQQLSHELAARGHHVEVVHCIDAFHLLSRYPPRSGVAEHPNVLVHRLKSPVGWLSPLATQQTGRPIFKSNRLAKILGQPFDVIHYHNISLVGGPAVLEYGRAIKLYTLHEYWLLCPTHMLFKFDREVCTKKACFSCTLTHRRPPQFWRYTGLIERTIPHVDLFLAPTAFTKAKHLESAPDMPIAEFPYFTSRWDTSDTPRPPSPGDPPYFLFVGRLEKMKGLQTLIEPFKRYTKAQLWVIGTGEYETTLQTLAGDCHTIRFLGFQTGEQLRRLYQQAIAVIVPSLWYEVFGIVILEAFAQRTPVIVRNRGGMPEVITESGGGFVFDTDEELMMIMDKLLDQPCLRSSMGQQGFEALQKRWTADVHLKRYFELIERIGKARKVSRKSPGVTKT